MHELKEMSKEKLHHGKEKLREAKEKTKHVAVEVVGYGKRKTDDLRRDLLEETKGIPHTIKEKVHDTKERAESLIEGDNDKFDKATDGLLGPPTLQSTIAAAVIQLLPALVTSLVLQLSQDGIITFLIFAGVLIGGPWAHCTMFDKDFKIILITGLKIPRIYLKPGLLAGIMAFIGLLATFYIFWYSKESHIEWLLELDIPLEHNIFYAVTFFMLLVFVNPFLEEMFWRVFLGRVFKDGELSKLVVSLHYALYHLFIIYYLTKDWGISFASMLFFFAGERLMRALRDGGSLIMGSFVHIGADLAFAIMYFQIYNQHDKLLRAQAATNATAQAHASSSG